MVSISNEQPRSDTRKRTSAVRSQTARRIKCSSLISLEQYNLARRLLDGVEDIDPSLYEIEDIELTDAE